MWIITMIIRWSKYYLKPILPRVMPTLGYKVLQDEIANKPYATGIYSYIGNQYYNQQQYAKSEEAYLKTIAIAPTISSYYASLGKINEMSNNKDKVD